MPYCFFMRLAFTLCTVAKLERSCAENFWTCAAAGLRVGDRWRPDAALQIVVTQVDKDTDGSMTSTSRQDGSGRDLSAGQVERDQ